jgi:hypothetical protein
MTRDEFNRACAVPGRLIKAFAEARAEMAERIERGGVCLRPSAEGYAFSVSNMARRVLSFIGLASRIAAGAEDGGGGRDGIDGPPAFWLRRAGFQLCERRKAATRTILVHHPQGRIALGVPRRRARRCAAKLVRHLVQLAPDLVEPFRREPFLAGKPLALGHKIVAGGRPGRNKARRGERGKTEGTAVDHGLDHTRGKFGASKVVSPNRNAVVPARNSSPSFCRPALPEFDRLDRPTFGAA